MLHREVEEHNREHKLYHAPHNEKTETRFCRWKTVEDNNNAKMNASPNIPCTFLLFKASAVLQIFFPRNLLFQQVLRMSIFLISKCLKTSNKRTHIHLFINQFVSLIELKM